MTFQSCQLQLWPFRAANRGEPILGRHGAMPHGDVVCIDSRCIAGEKSRTARYLLDDGLQAVLKFAAELGAGDERAHVERHDHTVLRAQRLQVCQSQG